MRPVKLEAVADGLMYATASMAALLAVAILGACAAPPPAASVRGACDAFDRPLEPVLGKRRQDQRWIDKTIEAGVSACDWSRPRSAPAA